MCGLAALALAPAAGADPVPLTPVYGSEAPGAAAGQFDEPDDVDFDGAGNLYVADYSNDRISVFSADGVFLRAFGYDVIPGGGSGLEVCAASCQAGVPGGAAGQLSGPSGVSVDAGGNLYVADYTNDRISVFTTQGQFLRAFGYDVDPSAPGTGLEVCTVSCKAGVDGGAAGQIRLPNDVQLDGSGNLYVADYGNDRILVFTTQGVFLRAFGFDVVPGPPVAAEVCTSVCKAGGGVVGAGGQLNLPYGLALGPTGDVYVADTFNDRISVFTAQGSFLRAFGHDVDSAAAGTGFEVCSAFCKAGVAGGDAGQLWAPSDVDFDAAGNLYVADTSNYRVSVFSPQDGFIRAFGFDVVPDGGTGFEVCTTSCQDGVYGNAFGQFEGPQGVAVDCRGNVFVADTYNHDVQRFAEPGTALPPCPAAPQAPSNDITFGKLKRNLKKGTAKLPVQVPGSGELELAGKGIKSQRKQPGAAGTTVVKVKAKGKAKRKLAEKGKLKTKLAVTFTPIGGEPNTETKKAKLKRRR